MAPKFGTSGLRGLVSELTEDLVADYIRAFLAACPPGRGLFVGGDLRPSTGRIARTVIETALNEGVDVTACGALPTPALAYLARGAAAAAVMVTGSHIPADRNGLKFYTPLGEITKADEAAILTALGRRPGNFAPPGRLLSETNGNAAFTHRYVSVFGSGALQGRRIGVYSHSAVGRGVMLATLRGLGAEVVEFGHSDTFIPVDTEAVDPDVARQIAVWVQGEKLDALISTDGDSDRPLLADETGRIVPGDILGQIAAQALGAEVVVTPVSSNSGVMRKGFASVLRTRIGSPFVIAAMEEAGGRVVGYEANGGFLLGFDAATPGGVITRLPTRDFLLPLLMVLTAAKGGSVSDLVGREPPVVTLSDRLQEIAPERSGPFLARLIRDPAARVAFLAGLGQREAATDLTDGLRITLVTGAILHLRPSGNAPEFRLYTEAEDAAAARDLMDRGLSAVRQALTA
ncbi:phosphohexomutase domain-containing protein [Pseudogemmobacter bohemicus]|uniref:phosphomannomutase n=1 Tax=Pseudogemmobacter bohemicus TaxID=2250708 RepID=UPI000DD4C1F3|nr:phosphomannomutase [Pseudogemmobacter bohemicus]